MTQYLSRTGLAARWHVSVKTIDRLREADKLPWVDLSAGHGPRPLVRFKIEDVEAFEQTMRRCPAEKGDDLSVK